MINKFKKLNVKELGSAATSVLAVALLYLIFHLAGIGCPIRFLTGISCPGCGMTRAAAAMIHLKPAQAFHFHPLIFFLPVVFLVYLLRPKIPPAIYKIFIFTFVLISIIIYIVRMCDPGNEIVYFHPEQGFLIQMIQYVIQHII